MISEQENTPEEVKSRVTQMTKAIRYKARKEGGNLFKAFNDYMGSQSGISSSERQLVKQKLGLSERYSSWRDELELREVVDVPSSGAKTDKEMEKTIKEKKVNNKIVINPTMQEAFDEIGGTILEVVEIEEGYKEIDKKKETAMYRRAGNLARTSLSSKGKKKEDAQNKSAKIVSAISRQKENERFSKMADEKARDNYNEESENDDMKKKQLQHQTQMLKKQQMLDRQRLQMMKQGKLPTGHMEEVEQVDEKVLDRAEKGEKERIVKGMKKKFSSFKDRYGKDAKSVMYATATKMAKDNMDTSKSDRRYGVE